MRCNLLVAGLVLFIGAASFAYAEGERRHAPDLADAVASVDECARTTFGVGVIALAMLAESSPGTFFAKDDLEGSGRLQAIHDLVVKGYASFREIDSGQGTLIEVTPTEEGKAIADALRHRS